MTRQGSGKSLERRRAGSSDVRVNEDPISIGIDKSISIDLSKMSAPTNQYDADFAWVEHSADEMRVSFMFGKRDRDGEKRLRTRLELRYPPENLIHNFWSNSRRFHEDLRAFIALWRGPKVGLVTEHDVRKWQAGKDHSEWANLEAISHAGSEATIDFYSFSPAVIAQYRRGGGSAGLRIEPVVRVHLSIFELLRMLEDMAPIVSEVEKYLPPSEAVLALKRVRQEETK